MSDDRQFASKSEERRHRALIRKPNAKATPPLMPSAERRRILFAPISINYHGHSRATWGGVAVNDDPSLLAKRHRPEWTEREFGE